MKRFILILILLISFFAEGQGILQNLERLRQEQAFSYDADAQAFITAVGTLTTPQEVAINNLVIGLKANGTWSKYHAIYPVIGGTASAHKWNLKDPRDLDAAFRLTFSGTITHTSTGMVSDGTTGFANTHYNGLLNGTANNISVSYYSRTNVNTAASEIGNVVSVSSRLLFRVRYISSTGTFAAYGTSGGTVIGTNTISSGYFVGTRTSLTDSRFYHNGTQSGSTQTGSNGTAPNLPLYLMANNEGGANQISNRECAFASIGLGLTPTEVANDYTVIQAFQTALGRQITP